MTNLDRFTTRLAVSLWLILLVTVTVRVAVARPGVQSVVPIYQTAGERYRAGESLYAPIPKYDLYMYPPGVAYAATTLTLVPERVGGIALRLVQVTIFLTGLRRLLRVLGPDWPALWVGSTFAVAAVLLAPAVNNGQLNVLVAGSLLHATAAVVTKRDAEAGGWLALAAAIKVYPLALALLLVLVRPRLLVWIVLCGGAMVSLPYLGQSREVVSAQYHEYWHYLGDDDRTVADLVRVPRDWTCWPRMMLGIVVSAQVSFAVSLLAAAGMALVTRWHTRRGDGPMMALIVGNTWMTVFGPSTESNTYSLLAGSVPIAFWLSAPGWPRFLAGVGVTLLLAPAVRGAFPDDWKFTVYGPQALGTLLVMLAAVAPRRRCEG